MNLSILEVLKDASNDLERIQRRSSYQSTGQTLAELNGLIALLHDAFIGNYISTNELDEVRDLPLEERAGRLSLVIQSVTHSLSRQTPMTKIPTIDPMLCFVVMSFRDDDHNHNDSYEYGIKRVVEECGYKCARTTDQDYNSSIYDQIVLNIQKARFVIGNLTHARPNCYYEVGYAHAMGKDVILVAREEDKDIHFDVRHYNIIIYRGSISALEQSLRRRIEGTVGCIKKP